MHVNTIVQKVDVRCKLRCACFESRYEIQHEVRMHTDISRVAGNGILRMTPV